VVFGSCRRARGDAPRSMAIDGADALDAYADRMAATGPEALPEALLLLGDQVYADDPAPQTWRWLDRHRDTTTPPGHEVADFTEYSRLYRDSWSDAPLRWLMLTVPTAMIFDDHDVRDDWNTSAAWRAWITAQAWWPDRIRGALAAYWVYQHIGNLCAQQRQTARSGARSRTPRGTPGRCCGRWLTPRTPTRHQSGGATGGTSTGCGWLSWTPAAGGC
jgi:hypothetical protein